MKTFFSKVIAWCASHIWQSVVIGVCTVSVVTSAIVLPIVLTNNDEDTGSNDDIDFSNAKEFPSNVYKDNIITLAALSQIDGVEIPSESEDPNNPYEKGNYEAYAKLMKSHAEDNPNKDFYFGYGISIKNNNLPTAQILDEYFPCDKPVIIASDNWHGYWLNTAAIKEYVGNFEGTEEEKTDVDNWIKFISKNDRGTDLFHMRKQGDHIIPLGYFFEVGGMRIIDQLPHTLEEIKTTILELQKTALSKNLSVIETPVIETANNKQVSALKELNASGKLRIKFVTHYEIREYDSKDTRDSELEKAIAFANETKNNDHFQVVGIEIYLDGTNETITSYTLEGYPAEYGKGDGYKGLQRWYFGGTDLTKELKELVYEVNEAGLAMKFHAMGDAAVRQALDACEYAVEQLEVQTPNYNNSIVGAASVNSTTVDANGFTAGLTDAQRFEKLGVSIIELA